MFFVVSEWNLSIIKHFLSLVLGTQLLMLLSPPIPTFQSAKSQKTWKSWRLKMTCGRKTFTGALETFIEHGVCLAEKWEREGVVEYGRSFGFDAHRGAGSMGLWKSIPAGCSINAPGHVSFEIPLEVWRKNSCDSDASQHWKSSKESKY